MSLGLLVMVVIAGGRFPGSAIAQRSSIFRQADPAVEQWMLRSRRSPMALGESISALTRMSEYEKVEALLKRVASAKYNAQQQAQIAAQIEPAQRLKITASPLISAASKQALDDLFATYGQQLTAPQRIRPAIDQMLAPTPDQRLPAIREVFQGSSVSVAELVGKIVATDDPRQRDEWLKALLRLDRGAGTAALRRLAIYGTDSVRANAITALSRIDRDAYLLDRLAEQHRRAASNQEQLPGRSEVLAVLRQQLDVASQSAVRGKREFGRESVWTINDQRNGVKLARMSSWVLGYRDAADIASRLSAMGDDDPASLICQANAQLGYRLANDPDWGFADQEVQNFVDQFPISPESTALNASWGLQSLDHAMATHNDPATIGWLRIMPRLAIPSMQWVGDASARPTALVRAVDHANATVRYEAAMAITAIRPPGDFAGSFRVRHRLAQMTRLGDQPVAVVLDNRPEIIAEWERVLGQVGLRALFVSTAHDLETCLATGDDFRLVLVQAEPKDARAIEVIDRVRRIEAARDVPMWIYTPAAEIEPIDLNLLDDTNAVGAAMAQAESPDDVSDTDLADDPDATADPTDDYIDLIVAERYGGFDPTENRDYEAERLLMLGALDADSTVRPSFDIQAAGERRWHDVSPRADLIRYGARPRSIAGMYELMLESRRRNHVPPLSPSDRLHFRNAANEAIQSDLLGLQ